MAKHRVHHYEAACTWSGDTGPGYEAYVRRHEARVPSSQQVLELSSDPAFRGDAKLINPEQLIVLAAASCQLLSFLAVAARAGLAVRKYVDHAQAEMPEDQEPIRIAWIRLNPLIELAAGPSEARVLELVKQAHDECYVSNSLRTEVTVHPTIRFV